MSVNIAVFTLTVMKAYMRAQVVWVGVLGPVTESGQVDIVRDSEKSLVLIDSWGQRAVFSVRG